MSDAPREAVWLALSELWLDNELSAADSQAIVRCLRASGLPLAELEAIYRCEVAPAVWLNQWVTAGVWEGFDPAWLFQRCRRNQARRRYGWHRWYCRLRARPMLGPTRDDWTRIRAQLE
ncbi:MAG: hypothetical protein GAK43_02350 [Stenotrophomonas maltophilia]|nr:MAG: hypothetical protein GAK43_02350 [Stenotrophomonas maltophilia]